jgi:integrase
MEINDKQAKVLEELLQGRTVKKDKVRLVDLKEKYLRERGRLSPATVHNYNWTFDRLLEKRELWFDNPSEVNEFIAGLSNIGDESVRAIFGNLRAIGRYTKRVYGWDDPTENADRPTVKHKTRRYFKDDELKAIVGACKDIDERVLITVLLDSTCRIKGIAGLKVEDLGKDGFKAREKTGERWYRCDPRLIEMMRELAVEGVVFPRKDDGRNVVHPVVSVYPNNLAGKVRRILRRAGLKGDKLGPHTLRHTGASIVAKSTRSALAVKALLQHDNISTSMKYIHDAEEDIQREISPMELSGVMLLKQGKLEMKNKTILAIPENTSMGDDVLINQMLPDIPKKVRIRPALNNEDLQLIRDSFLKTMVMRGEKFSGCKEVRLLRRIMRNV